MARWLDRATRAQRDRHLVAPPRRVRQPVMHAEGGTTDLTACAGPLGLVHALCSRAEGREPIRVNRPPASLTALDSPSQVIEVGSATANAPEYAAKAGSGTRARRVYGQGQTRRLRARPVARNSGGPSNWRRRFWSRRMPANEVSIRHQPTLARSSTAHTSDSQACSPGSRPITFTGRLSRRRRPTTVGRSRSTNGA